MSTTTILTAQDVHKTFDGTKAVDGVSFAVRSGEIFGFLGPNGAGKTTLIRMMLGIFQPDAGEIRFSFPPPPLEGEPNPNPFPKGKGGFLPSRFRGGAGGEVVGEGRFQPERVGYLPEERGLYEDRKVGDTLVFLAGLKRLPPKQARERALLWVTRLQLEKYFNRKIKELSKGMQQKIQFIAAILHEPDLVVLDEPFAGLDPVNQEIFRELILELKAQGTTVLLSAHQMHLVEDLVDRILLINKGRQILYGELHEIKRGWGEDWVKLDFQGDGEFLKNMPLVKRAQIENSRAQLILKEGVRPAEFFSAIAEKLEIEQISIHKPPLHHIFVELVTRETAQGEKA